MTFGSAFSPEPVGSCSLDFPSIFPYGQSGVQIHRRQIMMISLVDRPGCGPRGAGPPVPNSDASHCGTNAWQKSSTSQKTSTIQHHRLRHSAMAAYLKKPFTYNPLIARKPLIRVNLV
jgi:hypothetical protein